MNAERQRLTAFQAQTRQHKHRNRDGHGRSHVILTVLNQNGEEMMKHVDYITLH